MKKGHSVQVMFLCRIRNVSFWICLYTYLLTTWCRFLLEKLTGLQLVKKFSEFHGTRRFITALTSFRHLSLPWANPIQSIYPHLTSWRSILILSSHLHLGLSSGNCLYSFWNSMWREQPQFKRNRIHCWRGGKGKRNCTMNAYCKVTDTVCGKKQAPWKVKHQIVHWINLNFLKSYGIFPIIE